MKQIESDFMFPFDLSLKVGLLFCTLFRTFFWIFLEKPALVLRKDQLLNIKKKFKWTQKLNPAGSAFKCRCRLDLDCRVSFSFWVVRYNHFWRILRCWVNFSDMTDRSRLSIECCYWTRFDSFTGHSCCWNCLNIWRGASCNYLLDACYMNLMFSLIIFCIVQKSSLCPISRCSICIWLTTFPLSQESVRLLQTSINGWKLFSPKTPSKTAWSHFLNSRSKSASEKLSYIRWMSKKLHRLTNRTWLFSWRCLSFETSLYKMINLGSRRLASYRVE